MHRCHAACADHRRRHAKRHAELHSLRLLELRHKLSFADARDFADLAL